MKYLENRSIEEREIIIRMSQYIFSDESVDLQNNIQNTLIELTLFQEYPNSLHFSQFNGKFDDFFGIINFPSGLLRVILRRLCSEKRVYVDSGKYILNEDRYKEYIPIIEEKKKILLYIDKKIENICKDFSYLKENYEIVIEILYSLLVGLFRNGSQNIVKGILKKPDDFFTFSSVIEIFEDVVKDYGIVEKKYKDELRLCYNKLLEDDNIINEIISIVATNFLNYELLNIDPEFNIIEQSSFSKKRIILDTNVIISLLVSYSGNHSVTNNLISILSDIGIDIVYTTKTINEYIGVLEKANALYRKLANVRLDVLKKVNNLFIKAFIAEQISNPGLTWHGYYLSHRQIEKNLSKYNIHTLNVDKYEENILADDEFYNIIIDHVTKESIMNKRYKVAEHDAFHMILIREMRKEEIIDIMGPNNWFLTYDRTLINVDNKINEEIGTFEYPSSMMVLSYFELIMPFIGPEIKYTEEKKAFTELLKTNFALLDAGISSQLLIDLMGEWLNYDSLSTSEIEEILSDKQILQYWSKMNMVKEEKEKTQTKDELSTIIEQKVSKVLDEKLQEKEIELETEKRFNTFSKYICFIIGAFVIFFGLFTYNIYKNMALLIIFIFAGIILILISLNYSKLKFSFIKGEFEVER